MAIPLFVLSVLFFQCALLELGHAEERSEARERADQKADPHEIGRAEAPIEKAAPEKAGRDQREKLESDRRVSSELLHV
jgi:hypothetical protein